MSADRAAAGHRKKSLRERKFQSQDYPQGTDHPQNRSGFSNRKSGPRWTKSRRAAPETVRPSEDVLEPLHAVEEERSRASFSIAASGDDSGEDTHQVHDLHTIRSPDEPEVTVDAPDSAEALYFAQRAREQRIEKKKRRIVSRRKGKKKHRRQSSDSSASSALSREAFLAAGLVPPGEAVPSGIQTQERNGHRSDGSGGGDTSPSGSFSNSSSSGRSGSGSDSDNDSDMNSNRSSESDDNLHARIGTYHFERDADNTDDPRNSCRACSSEDACILQ